MNLPDLIEKLRELSDQLAARGVRDRDVQVMLWENEDDLAPIVLVEWDKFEVDGPFVVVIAKPGDPGT